MKRFVRIHFASPYISVQAHAHPFAELVTYTRRHPTVFATTTRQETVSDSEELMRERAIVKFGSRMCLLRIGGGNSAEIPPQYLNSPGVTSSRAN